jgi:hypothetical protein
LASRVVRIPLIPTGASPISPNTGASTDILINTLNGFARIALDGGKLFVSEGGTGNIYKINLASGTVSTLATAIATPAYPHTDVFPLAAAGGYLYAQANNTSIVEINETTGGLATIATAAANKYMYSNHIHSDGSAVYWNEMMGTTPNWVIRRYVPQSAQLTDVVSVPMNDMNYDWSIVNGQAWWFSGPGGASTALLQKAPVTGGPTTTVATLSTGGGGIVGDSTDLYYFTVDSHLVRMPQTGGTPVNISNYHYGSNAVALTASSVVWGGNAVNGIMTIPKTAQPVVPTTISQATFPSMQTYMTADASSLYWTTENFNPTTSSLSSWLVSGGPTNNLGTSDGNITRIFPYQNSLYLIRQTNTGWTISVLPNAGGSETVLVDSTTVLGEIPDAYVSNGVLYFTARDVLGGSGGVVALDLNTFKLSTLASGVSNPNHLYVDSSNVYWSTNGQSGGVFRTSLSGGTVETIYVGNWCWDIAGDNNNIYWADGWAIYSTKK